MVSGSNTPHPGIRKELVTQATNIIRVDFENAVLALCQHPCFDHADLSLAQTGKLLQNLLSDPPSDSPILDATQRQALIVAARTKFSPELLSPVLSQLFANIRYRLSHSQQSSGFGLKFFKSSCWYDFSTSSRSIGSRRYKR